MPDPLWFGPPESVAALLETSDPAAVVANIAAWLAEAIQHELSMGVSVANIGATLEQWMGLGGTAYGMKGSELNFLGLEPLAAHCLKHMAIGQAAVEANTVARSAVIPAIVCQTNRDETAALYASNICGCNTPAIAANEEMYFGQFTPQNMNAGLAYATVLNTLMGSIASTPPPITPAGFSPAAPVETVAQTAADTGAQASVGARRRGGAGSIAGRRHGRWAAVVHGVGARPAVRVPPNRCRSWPAARRRRCPAEPRVSPACCRTSWAASPAWDRRMPPPLRPPQPGWPDH